MDALRRHVLGYATSAAVGLAALRVITPTAIDLVFDVLTIGIVWGAVTLARHD